MQIVVIFLFRYFCFILDFSAYGFVIDVKINGTSKP